MNMDNDFQQPDVEAISLYDLYVDFSYANLHWNIVFSKFQEIKEAFEKSESNTNGSDLANLQDSMMSMQENIDQLELQSQRRGDYIDFLRKIYFEKMDECAKLKRNQSEYQTEINDQFNELEEMKNTAIERRQQFLELREMLVILETENRSYRESNAIKAAEQNIIDLHIQVGEVKLELKSEQEKNHLLTTQIKEFEVTRDHVESLTKENRRIGDENKLNEKKIEELQHCKQRELEGVAKELLEMSNRNVDQEKTITDKEVQLKKAENNAKELKSELSALSKEMQSYKREVQLREKSLADMEHMKDSHEKLQQCEEKLKSKDFDYRYLTNRCREKKNKIEQLKKKVKEALQAQQTLRGQLKDMSSKLEGYKERCEYVEGTGRDSRSHLMGEVARLTSELREAVMVELKEILQEMTDYYAALKMQYVEIRTADLDAKLLKFSENYTTLISPFDNKKIPESQANQHIHVTLLNPNWRDSKIGNARHRNQEESPYAPGNVVDTNLKMLAERRTDIFGTEETEIGRKLGEDGGKKAEKYMYDGHTTVSEASLKRPAEMKGRTDEEKSNQSTVAASSVDLDRIGPQAVPQVIPIPTITVIVNTPIVSTAVAKMSLDGDGSTPQDPKRPKINE